MKRLLTLAFVVLFCGLSTINAAIRYVDNVGVGPAACGGLTPCYTTIQDAIDNANPSDAIQVFSGTYVEDIVIQLDGLDLGPAPGADVIIQGIATVPIASWPLAVPNMDVQANNVKVHGFTITTPAIPADEYSNGITLTGQNIRIFDNDFVVDAGTNPTGSRAIFIQTYHKDAEDMATSNIAGLRVYNNTFNGDNLGSRGYYGVYLNRDMQPNMGNVVVENNQFNGRMRAGVGVERDNVTIRNNEFDGENIEDVVRGVWLIDWADTGVLNNVNISNNLIENMENAGIEIGGGGGTLADVTNIMITNNNFNTNEIGVLVSGDATPEGIEIHNNNINGNNTGVENDGAAGTLNATCNWWGDIGGPDEGDPVSGDVIYNPWLDAPFDDGGQCRLFVFLDDGAYPDDLTACANDSEECVVDLDDLDIPGADPDAEYSYSFNPSYLVETEYDDIEDEVTGTITRALRGGEYYLVVTDEETGYSGMTDIPACSLEVSEYNVIVEPGSVAHRYKAENITTCLNLFELALGVYNDDPETPGYDSDTDRYIDAEGNEYNVEAIGRVGWEVPDLFDPECYVPMPTEQIYLWIILTVDSEDDFDGCESAVRRLNVTVRGNEINIEI